MHHDRAGAAPRHLPTSSYLQLPPSPSSLRLHPPLYASISVQDLDQQLDLKKIIKTIKKAHCCNGTMVEDEEMGQVLQSISLTPTPTPTPTPTLTLT